MELFSEQQLVDCAQDFDNNGCRGGLPSHAFQYIHYAGGLETEDEVGRWVREVIELMNIDGGPSWSG